MYWIYLRPRRVEQQLSQRAGECQRCGACCRLLFYCPMLQNVDGCTGCKIYDHRSQVCRNFPLDDADLADRDLVIPGQPCGFHFNKEADR